MAAVPEARYRLLREVGRGSYGVVFEAQRSSSGAIVAVKRMPCFGPETAELALHEFWALRSVRGQHRNLVRLDEAVLQRSGPGPAVPGDFQPLAAHQQQRHSLRLVESCLQGRPCCPPDRGWTCAVWFVMEYCDGGTMNDYLLSRRAVHEATLNRRFMAQLASAVAFLHRSQIVHRDLKPENILVSSGRGQGPQLKVSGAWFMRLTLNAGLSAATESKNCPTDAQLFQRATARSIRDARPKLFFRGKNCATTAPLPQTAHYDTTASLPQTPVPQSVTRLESRP